MPIVRSSGILLLRTCFQGGRRGAAAVDGDQWTYDGTSLLRPDFLNKSTCMHIVHIYKDFYPVLGGIENHIKVLAEGLTARGHRVTVLVTGPHRHDQIIKTGLLTVIKAGRLAHVASTPMSWRMLVYARRLKNVDVVHLQFPYPPGDLAAMLIPRHPPLVVSYQSDIVRQRMLRTVYQPLLQHTLARAARIITSSPAYSASSPWLAPHRERCTVVPLSVDPQRFAHPDPGQVGAWRARYGYQPLVLFVGRLRYYKGLTFLLQALTHMRTPARLLLVGSGPEQQRLQHQAYTSGLMERVTFLGDVRDAELPAIYAAANVFVLPSHLRAEAFGIVQLEAQAAGLPIVCTEIGTGTSYITQHGRTGFVVPPAHPLALAQALDVLLANPALAQRMGQAGRTRAMQEFTHARMLEQVEQVYQSVVGHWS